MPKYEVTFGVYEGMDMRTWTAAYKAVNFAHVERLALRTLADNKDSDSFIFKIERW